MQSTGEKQQFSWTNKMVNDLISSIENFKALIEFKGKYSDGDRQAQWKALQKELFEKYKDFGTKELLKITNDAEQTDLQAKSLTITRQTSSVTLEAAI